MLLNKNITLRPAALSDWPAIEALLVANKLPLDGAQPHLDTYLLAWGEFNNAYERKEYMEPYVAEAVARQMMKDDPAIAAEFNQRLASDAEFAKDANARLEFFARKHASWDDRYQLYPVLRSQVVF